MGPSHANDQLDQDCIEDAVTLEVALDELDLFPEESTDTCVIPENSLLHDISQTSSSETVVIAGGKATPNCPDSLDRGPVTPERSPFQCVTDYTIPKIDSKSIVKDLFNPINHRKISCTHHHSVLCQSCQFQTVTKSLTTLGRSDSSKSLPQCSTRSPIGYKSHSDSTGHSYGTKSRPQRVDGQVECTDQSSAEYKRWPHAVKNLEGLCQTCHNCFCFEDFKGKSNIKDSLLSSTARCPSPLSIDCEDILEEDPTIKPLLTDIETSILGSPVHVTDFPLPDLTNFQCASANNTELAGIEPSIGGLDIPSVIPNLLDLEISDFNPQIFITPALRDSTLLVHKGNPQLAIPSLLTLSVSPTASFLRRHELKRSRRQRRCQWQTLKTLKNRTYRKQWRRRRW